MNASRTLTTKKGMTVVTTLSDSEALAVLGRCPGEFAAKLYDQQSAYNLASAHQGTSCPRGYWPLKGDQITWMHKLANDQLKKEAAPAAAPAPAALAQQMDKVLALFNTARSSRKYPKMRFVWEGAVIVLSMAGERSKAPDTINVTDDGKYPDNVWYGRIEKDGRFSPSRKAQNECLQVFAFLERLAADPVKVAEEYGHTTGNCCFCGKELTVAKTPWGPECGRVWGLPYSSITEMAKRAARSRAPRSDAKAAEETPREPEDGPGDGWAAEDWALTRLAAMGF